MITIKNDKNLKIVFSDIGASVYAIYYDENILTCTPTNIEEFEKSLQFYGKTLGLVAGRINCFQKLNKKDVVLQPVVPNKNFVLHGGDLQSLSFVKFNYHIVENESTIDVIFNYECEKMMNIEGFHHVVVKYSIYKKENCFDIELSYKNDKSESFCNLSNHIYWNLDNCDVTNSSLLIDSSKIATCDNNLVIDDVTFVSHYLNFKTQTPIKDHINEIEKSFKTTIDDTYILDNDERYPIILETEKYKLICQTDYSSVNIYLNNNKKRPSFISIDDKLLYSGIAIEPQNLLIDDKQIRVSKNTWVTKHIKYTITKK